MKMKLDPAQRAAASHGLGPCLVLAGPGSGKTTVITARTLFLIQEKKVRPEHILVLTFTRQAAGEMRERFLRACGEGRGSRPQTGDSSAAGADPGVRFATFHSFFYQMLQRFRPEEGLRIISERERRRLIRELLLQHAPTLAEEAGIEERLFSFFSSQKSEKIPGGRQAGETAKVKEAENISNIWGKRKNEKPAEAKTLKANPGGSFLTVNYPENKFEKKSSGEKLEGQYPERFLQAKQTGESGKGEVSAESEKFLRLQALYEAKKQERGFLDYDDILLEALKLLKERPPVLQKLRSECSFIMVDEFQDVSPLQYRLLCILAAPKNNLFAVGDDDQSIYAFRGADASVMLNFRRDHPAAKVLLLDRNYRSGSAVVEASLRLISHNRFRFQKALFSAAGRTGQVEIFRMKDAAGEYRKIAEICKELEEGGGTGSSGNPGNPGTIAVLVRTNEEAVLVQQALSNEGVFCETAGKQESFFRDPLFHPYFAYLSLASGNENRQNLLRILNYPPRLLPREDLLLEGSLDGLLRRYKRSGHRQLANEVKKLKAVLAGLRKLKDPYAMLSFIRGPLGTDAHLRTLMKERQAEESLKKLDRLMESARPCRSTEEWFRMIAKETAAADREAFGVAGNSGTEGKGEIARNSKTDGPEGKTGTIEKAVTAGNSRTEETAGKASPNDSDSDSPVRILTLHAAKGLEFDTVFIPGLNEGNLPHMQADGSGGDVGWTAGITGNSLRSAGSGSDITEVEKALEEERRLFYVGMTRAKKALFLLYREERSGKTQKVSRFIREIRE